MECVVADALDEARCWAGLDEADGSRAVERGRLECDARAREEVELERVGECPACAYKGECQFLCFSCGMGFIIVLAWLLPVTVLLVGGFSRLVLPCVFD